MDRLNVSPDCFSNYRVTIYLLNVIICLAWLEVLRSFILKTPKKTQLQLQITSYLATHGATTKMVA